MEKKALLIDITRCVGCNACQDGCQEQNGLPDLSTNQSDAHWSKLLGVDVSKLTDKEDKLTDKEKEELKDNLKNKFKDKLSDNVFTALRSFPDIGPSGDDVYVRQLCRHCNEPACKSVCLVDAFTKTKEGAVVYDGDKCIGCRNCIQACPFYVPRYEWSKTFPRVKKCVLCHDRIANGQPTACAEACANSLGEDDAATMFGDYDEMVTIAEARMKAKPKSDENPDGYEQKIYGLKEVGGTTVLYLSSLPFEQLGFDTKLDKDGNPAAGFNAKLEEGDMPDRTMRALSKVPYVVGVGAVVLGGIWWITNRRHEVEKHEANNDSHNK